MKRPAVRIPDDPAATKALADQFVAAYWTWLAARAWRDHGCLGRGALVIPWSLVADFAAGIPRPFGAQYATAFEIDLILKCLATYDPEMSIVIVFIEDQGLPERGGPVRLFGAMAAWIFSREPFPPAAHALVAN